MNKKYIFLYFALPLFPFCAAPTSLKAQAQSVQSDAFDPDTRRILSDPLYLPLAGQIYGSTSYSFSNPTGDVYGSTGAKQLDFSRETSLFGQSLAYGLTDDLSVHLSDAYGRANYTNTSAFNGGRTTFHFTGFENPTFGASYRAIDQAAGFPVDLDLRLDYTPNAIDARAAGNGSDGTIASGRDETGMSLTLGREMRDVTIAGSFTASHLGDREYSLPYGGNFRQSSGWNYGFAINTQTRLTDQWSVNAGIGYTLVDDFQNLNERSGLSSRTRSDGNFDVNAALNYQFIPDRFVGSLTYQYSALGDVSEDYMIPAMNTQTRNYDANIVGVRLEYVFN